MKRAEDQVQIWAKVKKRRNLREPVEVFVYGQFHRSLQLEMRPYRSLLAALKDKDRISRKHTTDLPTELHPFSGKARRVTDSMVRQNACNTLGKQHSSCDGPYSFLRNQHCGSFYTGF